MKSKELRELPEAELKARLQEFKKELLKLNVELSMGSQGSSPGKFRKVKKGIARIHTILREKEVQAQ